MAGVGEVSAGIGVGYDAAALAYAGFVAVAHRVTGARPRVGSRPAGQPGGMSEKGEGAHAPSCCRMCATLRGAARVLLPLSLRAECTPEAERARRTARRCAQWSACALMLSDMRHFEGRRSPRARRRLSENNVDEEVSKKGRMRRLMLSDVHHFEARRARAAVIARRLHVGGAHEARCARASRAALLVSPTATAASRRGQETQPDLTR